MSEQTISSVRQSYDRWATIYDHDANPLQALEGPAVRAAVGDPYGLTILDLGCGTGRHALWLAAAGAKVTAVDFSEGMLAEARRKPGADSVNFLARDLHQSLPFADMSFELIVSGLVLEHLQSLELFFSEATLVMKPNGARLFRRCIPRCFCEELKLALRTLRQVNSCNQGAFRIRSVRLQWPQRVPVSR